MSGPKSKPDFTCGHCNRVMCIDCLSMASEFEYLFKQRTTALIDRDEKLTQLRREIEFLKRQNAHLEEIARLGIPESMKRWIDWEIKNPPVEKIG